MCKYKYLVFWTPVITGEVKKKLQLQRPDWPWGPPNLLSPGVKRPGRESDHSPPASAEVKKILVYTSTPPYAFTA
jgi:hypothetical protein